LERPDFEIPRKFENSSLPKTPTTPSKVDHSYP
jgi:hypothetical protein